MAAMPSEAYDLVFNRQRLRRAAGLLRRDLELGQVDNMVLAQMLSCYFDAAAEGDWLGELAMKVFESDVRALFERLERQ